MIPHDDEIRQQVVLHYRKYAYLVIHIALTIPVILFIRESYPDGGFFEWMSRFFFGSESSSDPLVILLVILVILHALKVFVWDRVIERAVERQRGQMSYSVEKIVYPEERTSLSGQESEKLPIMENKSSKNQLHE